MNIVLNKNNHNNNMYFTRNDHEAIILLFLWNPVGSLFEKGDLTVAGAVASHLKIFFTLTQATTIMILR